MTGENTELRRISADEWWEAVGTGNLLVLRCSECSYHWLPWLGSCPACGTTKATTLAASGYGRVYSWVTVRYPESDPDLPRTTAAVRLDEGPVLYARLRVPDGEPTVEMRVAAVYTTTQTGVVVEFVPKGD